MTSPAEIQTLMAEKKYEHFLILWYFWVPVGVRPLEIWTPIMPTAPYIEINAINLQTADLLTL